MPDLLLTNNTKIQKYIVYFFDSNNKNKRNIYTEGAYDSLFGWDKEYATMQ